jgi:hypothetical protein
MRDICKFKDYVFTMDSAQLRQAELQWRTSERPSGGESDTSRFLSASARVGHFRLIDPNQMPLVAFFEPVRVEYIRTKQPRRYMYGRIARFQPTRWFSCTLG